MLRERQLPAWTTGLLVCAACLIGPPTGRANDNPALGIGEPTTPPCPPGGCCPNPPCCDKPPCCKKPPCDCKGSGSPVSARFGALRLPFTDLQYRIGDIQFDIERSYGSDEFYVGYLGRGVTSTLDQMSISTFNGGTAHELVVVRTPQGQRYEYLRQPDSSYTGPLGHYDLLTKVGAEFKLANLDGITWTFDEATGFLISRSDKNGHTASFTYHPDGRPATIDLFPGRTIAIAYGANGFVESLSDFAGRTVSYAYDADGRLTEFVDAESHPWNYDYAPAGMLTAIVSPLGDTTLSVTYDADGRVSRMIDKDGDHTYTYANGSTTKRDNALSTILGTNVNQTVYYDGQGVITRITHPNSTNDFFNYDGTFSMTRQTDRLGRNTTYAYDAKGRVTLVTYPDNSSKAYTYHPTLEQYTSERNERNVITLWEYDAAGNVTREVKASGTPREQVATYSYDPGGRLTHQMDAVGRVTTMSYDALGQLTQQVAPGPITLAFEYDLLGNMTLASDQTGNEVQYIYDDLLRHIETITPEGDSSTQTFDAAGRMTGFVDPALGVETYEFDGLGHETRVINGRAGFIARTYVGPYVTRLLDSLNRETLYTYNNRGEIIRTTRNSAADGNRITNVGLDNMGQELTSTSQNGLSETRTYDLRGRLATLTRGDGLNEIYLYDPVGNITSQKDFWGNTTLMGYDELNRTTSLSDNFGLRSTTVYDAADRMVQETLPRGTRTYAYDAAGNRTQFTDADGHTQTFAYDALNRLTAMVRPGGRTITAVLDSMARPTQMSFPSGRVMSATYHGGEIRATITEEGGRVTQFGYDGTNSVTDMTLPDGDAYGYTYDSVGRGTLRSFPDSTEIRAEYSDYDVLKKMIYPDNSERVLTYNASDVITAVTDSSGTMSFGYDALGRQTSQTYNGRTITWAYSADYKTLTTTYPSGRVVTRQLNTRLQTASISLNGDPGPLVTYTYAADNVPISAAYSSGVTANFTFSGESFVQSAVYTRGVPTVRGWSRGTDDQGSTMYVERLDDPTRSFQVLRDLDDKVTGKRVGTLDAGHTVPAPTRTEAFGMTGVGNWNSYSLDGVSETRTHDLNNRILVRTVAGGPITLGYDGKGNLTDDGTLLYAYNYDSMLTEVRLKADNSLVESYGYDPLGNLVRIITAGGDTLEFVRDQTHIIETYRNGVLEAVHVYGGNIDEHVCSIVNGTRYFYITDLGMNVAALTDATGNVVESYEYDAYGRPRFFDAAGAPLAGTAVANLFLFNGQPYSAATQLYYYRARFLSLELGRFLTPDPMGINTGYMPNLYEYAISSPIDRTDPFGLCVEGCNTVTLKVPGSIGHDFGGLAKFGWSGSVKTSGSGSVKWCTKCCKDGGCGYTREGNMKFSGSASYRKDITPLIMNPYFFAFKVVWDTMGGQVGLYFDISGSITFSQKVSYDSCEGKLEGETCTEAQATAAVEGGISTPKIKWFPCTAEAWAYGSASYSYKCCIKSNAEQTGCKHCLQGKLGVKGNVTCTSFKFWSGKTVGWKKEFDYVIWNPKTSGCN